MWPKMLSFIMAIIDFKLHSGHNRAPINGIIPGPFSELHEKKQTKGSVSDGRNEREL